MLRRNYSHHISKIRPCVRFFSSKQTPISESQVEDDEEQDDFFTDIHINDRLDAIVSYDDYKEDRSGPSSHQTDEEQDQPV